VRELPQLQHTIRKFGNRYYGIRLIERAVAKLPRRRGER